MATTVFNELLFIGKGEGGGGGALDARIYYVPQESAAAGNRPSLFGRLIKCGKRESSHQFQRPSGPVSRFLSSHLNGCGSPIFVNSESGRLDQDIQEEYLIV